MKHTLKTKYAADSLNAHRQRAFATQPDVLAYGPKAAARRKTVEAVTARLSKPTSPLYSFESPRTVFAKALHRDELARVHGILADRAIFAATTAKAADAKRAVQADIERAEVVAKVTARLDGPPKAEDNDTYDAIRYALSLGAMRVRSEAVIKVSCT